MNDFRPVRQHPLDVGHRIRQEIGHHLLRRVGRGQIGDELNFCKIGFSLKEVLQALAYNPSFFRSIYVDLIQHSADEAAIRTALGQIDGYLTAKHMLLFAPILHYLSEADGARSVSELDLHFKKRAQVDSLGSAYEWLADRGVLRKLSTPVRMTRKSSVFMDEAAYYYDGDEA